MKRGSFGEPKPKGPPLGGLSFARAPSAPTRAPNQPCGKDFWRVPLLSTWPAVNPGDRPSWLWRPKLSDSRHRSWVLFYSPPKERGVQGSDALSSIPLTCLHHKNTAKPLALSVSGRPKGYRLVAAPAHRAIETVLTLRRTPGPSTGGRRALPIDVRPRMSAPRVRGILGGWRLGDDV